MKELDWNSARAFCTTADAGSLSAAARKLGLAYERRMTGYGDLATTLERQR